MSKELSAKERIISLSEVCSPAEIAKFVGTSIGYVNNVLAQSKKANNGANKPALTLANYVAAHRIGIRRKNDLAAFFGVDRRTINRFENRPEIKEHFNQYIELRNNGYNLTELLQRLTSIHETLSIFEPDSKTAQSVKQAIELLQKCDKKDNLSNY